MLLVKGDMLEPLRQRVDDGMPVFGTCAGMILCSNASRTAALTSTVVGHSDRVSPQRVRQIDSFEAELDVTGLDEPFHGVFIRAPVVDSVGDDVTVFAAVDGQPVLCSHGPVMVVSLSGAVGRPPTAPALG